MFLMILNQHDPFLNNRLSNSIECMTFESLSLKTKQSYHTSDKKYLILIWWSEQDVDIDIMHYVI